MSNEATLKDLLDHKRLLDAGILLVEKVELAHPGLSVDSIEILHESLYPRHAVRILSEVRLGGPHA